MVSQKKSNRSIIVQIWGGLEEVKLFDSVFKKFEKELIDRIRTEIHKLAKISKMQNPK